MLPNKAANLKFKGPLSRELKLWISISSSPGSPKKFLKSESDFSFKSLSALSIFANSVLYKFNAVTGSSLPSANSVKIVFRPSLLVVKFLKSSLTPCLWSDINLVIIPAPAIAVITPPVAAVPAINAPAPAAPALNPPPPKTASLIY